MYNSYYKKVDRSMMDWGLTIPQDFVKYVEGGKHTKLGTSRPIKIIWDKKKYEVKLCHVNRKAAKPVHQIRWDSNKDLLKKLRKTFIQSYITLKSQKELFDKTKKESEHFRTKLVAGRQEVLKITPVSSKQIEFKAFIQIENEWNPLFERLADENVFGWLFDKDKKYLISHSTKWFNVKTFNKHKNATNIIYYLVHSKKKLIYVGKAEVLGKRVAPGRKHQNMPGDWDLFRYDVVKPEFSGLLERIEDHTIRAFAGILKNTKGYPSLNLSSYKIVNSNWKKP